MNSAIQQRINPPVPASQLEFVKGDGKELDPDVADQVDFLKLLNNSNADVKRQREAEKNGDLSGAKNYDDFLENLERQTTKLREPKNTLDKDDFLKLFVTQLQHQDPLAPEDSTEMASRLAQFNGLEQMLNVNKTLEKMHSAQTQTRSIDMVNYIGKDITVDGGRIKYNDGKYNESTFRLRRPASTSTLEIRDEAGTVIASQELGTLPEGEHSFKWDGKTSKGESAPSGTYTYAIIAKGINNDEIPVSLETKTRITGVDIKNKEGGLFTPLGPVTFEDIKSIGDTGFVTQKEAKAPAPSLPNASTAAMSPEAAQQQMQAIAEQLTRQARMQHKQPQPQDTQQSASTKAVNVPVPTEAAPVAHPTQQASQPPVPTKEAGKPTEQPASTEIPG